MLRNLLNVNKKALSAQRLGLLSQPQRCKLPLFLKLFRFLFTFNRRIFDFTYVHFLILDFRASQALNENFNVYVDGRPVSVSSKYSWFL